MLPCSIISIWHNHIIGVVAVKYIFLYSYAEARFHLSFKGAIFIVIINVSKKNVETKDNVVCKIC